MNVVSHIPRKSVTAFIRDMVDGWRKIHGWSQSTVVAEIVAAHKAIDAERSSEIVFEEERRGRDLTHCQRINMQRFYRWLETEDGPGHMPANMLPSVLAALPVHLRVQLANEILEPCGLAARALNGDADRDFDPMSHLTQFLVEYPQAKQALLKMATCKSGETAMATIQELDDVIRVTTEARNAIEASMLPSIRSVA